MSILRKLRWPIRAALGLTPGNAEEEVWRLRGLRRAPAGVPGVVSWRGCPLHYRDGAALLGQLNDIFVGEAYDFAAGTNRPVILDAGAHVGAAVIRWREQFAEARITAFEADPAIAALLRQNLSERNDSLTEIHAAAAWIADGQLAFKVTGSDSGHIDSAGESTVPALDLAKFCAEPVDLLKLDIEGAEEAVIAHLATTGALARVKRLVCEWHEWEPRKPRLHSTLQRLAEAGYIYRIVEAYGLGPTQSPDFPKLGWPGNQMMIYAWRL